MSRLEQIHDLIVEELRERGDLESGDNIRYWMNLISVYSADEEEEFGCVFVLDSDPSPSPDQRLGMMDHHRLQLQAIFTRLMLRDDE